MTISRRPLESSPSHGPGSNLPGVSIEGMIQSLEEADDFPVHENKAEYGISASILVLSEGRLTILGKGLKVR